MDPLFIPINKLIFYISISVVFHKQDIEHYVFLKKKLFKFLSTFNFLFPET